MYGYNSDGFRVRDTRNPPITFEYRSVCGIGCGRMPLRVYRSEGGFWVNYEWYVLAFGVVRWL